jgi:5-methylcytosine-specific restriction endonuclease McrA
MSQSISDGGKRKWQPVEERNRLKRSEVVELFLAQDGRCPNCGQELKTKGHLEVEAIDEHVKPLWLGGTNRLDNRALFCIPCAKGKTAKEATQRAKGKRVFLKHAGIKKVNAGGFRGHRKFDGTIVWKDRK